MSGDLESVFYVDRGEPVLILENPGYISVLSLTTKGIGFIRLSNLVVEHANSER